MTVTLGGNANVVVQGSPRYGLAPINETNDAISVSQRSNKQPGEFQVNVQMENAGASRNSASQRGSSLNSPRAT